jgi:hypothetical protein
VTKEIGAAGIYRPEAALATPGPTPLVHVGDLVLPSSDTVGGPIGGFGSRTVTGGAVSADGRVVALRTYTDAWLFPVPADGEVADALRGTPVRVPLPGEPQGEALAFTADGTLLSGSEARGGVDGQLRAVPGAAALAVPAVPPAGSASSPDARVTASPSVRTPTAQPLPAGRSAAIGAVAVVGVLGLLAAGMAWHAARRR